jgi:hypothetical protein
LPFRHTCDHFGTSSSLVIAHNKDPRIVPPTFQDLLIPSPYILIRILLPLRKEVGMQFLVVKRRGEYRADGREV